MVTIIGMVKLDSDDCSSRSDSPSSSPMKHGNLPSNQWELRIQFIAAVQENDLTTARAILNEHYPAGHFEPDECYSAEESNSAMIMAIERGYPEMVKLLIEFGASVNRYTSGFSPLHYAAANGSIEIVNILLLEQANVNAVSVTGYTPLLLASQTKSHETVGALIEAGSRLEKTDPNGRTALSIACANNRLESARILIDHGSDVNTMDLNGNTPLLHSLDQFYTVCPLLVKLLLDSGANPNHMNSAGQLALVTAVRRCSESNLDGQSTVKELISHNCSIDSIETGLFGENALHSAISRCQDRIIELLIRAGTDLTIQHHGFTPLERLAGGGNIDLLKLALAAGAKPELSKSAWELVGRLREDQINTIESLINGWGNNCLPLKHLCRVRLRRFWSRNADSIISSQLVIPSSVKKFLLLVHL